MNISIEQIKIARKMPGVTEASDQYTLGVWRSLVAFDEVGNLGSTIMELITSNVSEGSEVGTSLPSILAFRRLRRLESKDMELKTMERSRSAKYVQMKANLGQLVISWGKSVLEGGQHNEEIILFYCKLLAARSLKNRDINLGSFGVIKKLWKPLQRYLVENQDDMCENPTDRMKLSELKYELNKYKIEISLYNQIGFVVPLTENSRCIIHFSNRGGDSDLCQIVVFSDSGIYPKVKGPTIKFARMLHELKAEINGDKHNIIKIVLYNSSSLMIRSLDGVSLGVLELLCVGSGSKDIAAFLRLELPKRQEQLFLVSLELHSAMLLRHDSDTVSRYVQVLLDYD